MGEIPEICEVLDEVRVHSGRPGDRTLTTSDMNSAPVCAVCGKPIQNARRGRPAKYCGNACRQRAFRMRSKPEAQEQPPGEGLPEILDEFVGRIPELRRLRALRRTARLLTLVGPGGAGKTNRKQGEENDPASTAR